MVSTNVLMHTYVETAELPVRMSDKLPSAFLLVAAVTAVLQAIGPMPSAVGMAYLIFAFGVVSVTVIRNELDRAFPVFVLIASTRFLIPGSDRDLQELLVPWLALILVFREHRSLSGLFGISTPGLIFLSFACLAFFRGLELPSGVLQSTGEPTGFRARLLLLTSVMTVLAAAAAGRRYPLLGLVHILKRFYSIVLLLSLVLLIAGVESAPLFNTFSWKVFQEPSGSIRFGILGVAGIAVFTLMLSNPMSEPSRQRRIWLALSALGVLLSGGRADLVGMIVVMLAYVAIVKRRLVQTLLAVMAVGGILFVVSTSNAIDLLPDSVRRVFLLVPSEAISNPVELNSGESAMASTSWRMVIWLMAAENILERPWFGNGFGVPFGDPELHEMQVSTMSHDFMVMGNAHNSFISIAYLMGIPAALCFLLWLVNLFIGMYKAVLARADKISLWLLLVLLSSVIGAFVSDVHTGAGFCIAAGLAEGWMARSRKEMTNGPDA